VQTIAYVKLKRDSRLRVRRSEDEKGKCRETLRDENRTATPALSGPGEQFSVHRGQTLTQKRTTLPQEGRVSSRGPGPHPAEAFTLSSFKVEMPGRS